MRTIGHAHGDGWRRRWLVLLFCVISSGASDTTPSLTTDLVVPLDGTRLQVAGGITVHRGEHTVRVPAVVNQHRGLVEYLLVHTTGKRHEALFTTSVEPQHLHLACLLAGAPESGATPCAALVTVTWQGHGPTKQVRPEDLLLPAAHDGEPIAGETTAPAGWTYHGSHFTADGFAAQRDGSCIALQTDAAALMHAPGLQAREFVPAAERMPAVGTPVTLVIIFPPPSSVIAQEIP